MDESINVENKKQNHQKQPISRLRIIGEILAGAVAGFTFVLLVIYAIYFAFHDKDRYVTIGFIFLFLTTLPLLYGLGSVVGVYLVGNKCKQTGSLLITLAGGFVGGLVIVPFFLSLCFGRKAIVHLVPLLILLLIPPIIATICFNLRLLYKVTSSS